MKKYILFVILIGNLCGCHIDETSIYGSGRYVHFATVQGMDSVHVSFANYPDQKELTLYFKVNLIGDLLLEPTSYVLAVVDSLTTAIEGQDYVLEKVIMPAKTEFVDAAVIRWNRRPDGDDGRPDTLTVGLRLVENEYFKPVTLGSRIMKLTYLKTDMQAPYWWIEEALGPWSKGLMFKFLEQYNQLEETNPEIYQSIHKYVGDNFSDTYYWPWSVDYLVIKYVVAPLYNYYQEHPEPGVVDIPKPKY